MHKFLSTPVNVDYQYYIAEKKRIPKTTEIEYDVIIKEGLATRTSSSLGYGERLFICATNKYYDSNNIEHTGIFFAIHNTIYNLTEYIFEDRLSADEIFKDIQINENVGYVAIISTYDGGNSFKIRGFSLESNSLIS